MMMLARPVTRRAAAPRAHLDCTSPPPAPALHTRRPFVAAALSAPAHSTSAPGRTPVGNPIINRCRPHTLAAPGARNASMTGPSTVVSHLTVVSERHLSVFAATTTYNTCRSRARFASTTTSSTTPTPTTMATLLTSRRPHSTNSHPSKGKEPAREDRRHDHHDEHDRAGGDSHGHSHSGSVFGSLSHSHTHSHGEEGHGDAERVVQALRGGGDRGSRITLIGLAANVGLTVSKGTAGWYLNSASLLADAGHTAGDLIGDLITLVCWKLSRRPPSEAYPYGFGKFEVLGSAAVSLLLTGGALLLGLHSVSLLADSLSQVATTLPSGPLHDVLLNVSEIAHSVPSVAHEHAHTHAHAHGHGHALDPNAAWFAGAGVLAKEWLFRATKKVADEESSPVLLANAYHHRSDAYSSLVALVAILGTWWFPHLPLDPIGGLVVSVLIVQQGWAITMIAFRQLTDASVGSTTKKSLLAALQPLLSSNSEFHLPAHAHAHAHAHAQPPTQDLLAIHDLRAMRAGALMFVDLTAEVPRTLNVADASALEGRITEALKKARKEVAEVRVRFRPASEDGGNREGGGDGDV